MIRILIIEDDPDRVEKLCSWLPADVIAVTARSAGTAMGVLKRSKGKVYAGIMLDHDLEKRPVCETDLRLCGQDVVHLIVENIPRHVPNVSAESTLLMSKVVLYLFYYDGNT